uniref:Uncharacterized protein n=1 Tax=Mus spicilegus TaxID=10103 RepID=A0A8C6I8I8_MUSSI
PLLFCSNPQRVSHVSEKRSPTLLHPCYIPATSHSATSFLGCLLSLSLTSA